MIKQNVQPSVVRDDEAKGHKARATHKPRGRVQGQGRKGHCKATKMPEIQK